VSDEENQQSEQVHTEQAEDGRVAAPFQPGVPEAAPAPQPVETVQQYEEPAPVEPMAEPGTQEQEAFVPAPEPAYQPEMQETFEPTPEPSYQPEMQEIPAAAPIAPPAPEKKKKEPKMKDKTFVEGLEDNLDVTFSILFKLLTLIIGLTVVSLTVLYLIADSSLLQVGDMASEESKDALIEQQESSLQIVAGDKAVTIEKDLLAIENVVNTMANQAEMIWETPANFQSVTSYYHNSSVAGITLPPRYLQDADRKQSVSWDASAYKLAPRVFHDSDAYNNTTVEPSVPAAPGDMSAATAALIAQSSAMDPIFINVMSEHPELTWVYFGMQDGVHRTYPYHAIGSRGYDPAERGWYTSAVSANGSIVWSSPYFDSTTQIPTITASKAVYESDGTLIGVVGADMQLPNINAAILGFSIADGEGRAFLLDSNDYVLAHRNLTSGSGLTTLLTEFEDLTTEDYDSLVNANTTSGTLMAEYINGDEYLYAFSTIESTGFTVGLVVPKDVVIADALATADNINERTATAQSSLQLVTIVFIALGLLLGISQGNKIVRPIKQLTETANKVRAGKLDETIEIVTRDEIGALGKAFEKMVTVIKISNQLSAKEAESVHDTWAGTSEEGKVCEACETRVADDVQECTNCGRSVFQ